MAQTKNAKVVNGKSEDRKVEREWREIEKAFDYLARTSKPGVSWQELLGRGYETDHRLERVR